MKRTLIAAAALATFAAVVAPQAALAGCAEFQITGQDLSLEYIADFIADSFSSCHGVCVWLLLIQ